MSNNHENLYTLAGREGLYAREAAGLLPDGMDGRTGSGRRHHVRHCAKCNHFTDSPQAMPAVCGNCGEAAR